MAAPIWDCATHLKCALFRSVTRPGIACATGNDLDWGSLALFFLAGLGLTFTPCVLPMLPILPA